MPLYIQPDKVHPPIPRVEIFYSDDSVCEIFGKAHTIIGAIRFEDERQALGSMHRCRKRLGISRFKEIKWNSQGFTRTQREQITDELLPTLGSATGFLTIVEGLDKQLGATKLMKQLSDYCRSNAVDAFTVTFDRSIIQSGALFDSTIEKLEPGCIGWSDADSAHSPLVQLADLFCGFQKWRIDAGSRKVDGQKRVNLEFYEGEVAEYELGYYFHAGLRYSLWGKVRGEWDSAHMFVREPWKHNLGYGLRIHSTVGRAALLQAVSELREEFMGCIH